MPRQNCPLCTWTNGASTRVDVEAIRRSFRNGGMVANNIERTASIHERHAREMAPYRTGYLRNQHFYNIDPATAAPARSYHVGTHANYAIFLRGTANKGAGMITPKNGDELELRPAPYSWFVAGNPERFREAVRGQKPHPERNWLKASLLRTLLELGLLTLKGYGQQVDALDKL